MTEDTAILERVIFDISLREVCFISDTANPRYISWNNTEEFMRIWRECQSIKDNVEISYTFRTKDRPTK
jgi:hypothetical protein